MARAVIETKFGEIEIEFLDDKAPGHVKNFVDLAKKGVYDGTTFHRVIPGFMIQGGDPKTKDAATPRGMHGTGGPGYTIKAEFNDTSHRRGIVSMARSNDPNSAGSQFFFLANEGGRYLGDTAQLGPSAGTYVPFGKVTKGLDVLQKIAALDDGSSAPSKPVTITSVRIRES